MRGCSANWVNGAAVDEKVEVGPVGAVRVVARRAGESLDQLTLDRRKLLATSEIRLYVSTKTIEQFAGIGPFIERLASKQLRFRSPMLA
jgi:hypothetical protein